MESLLAYGSDDSPYVESGRPAEPVTADSALSTSTSSNFWFDHLIVHLTIGASYSSSTSRETTRCGGFSAAL